MYTPNYFKAQSYAEVEQFVKENAFAILTSQHKGRLIATHIPLIISEKENGDKILSGHVAKGNQQWKSLEDNDQVLAIFSEPHTYVSSSWYDHVNVPTWNYIAVHLYGKARLLTGEELMTSLHELVDKYEHGTENRFHIEDMPDKMLKNELRGIVGFEILIEDIEAAFKLSQNRDEKNHQAIIEKLEERGDSMSQQIADEMKKRNND